MLPTLVPPRTYSGEPSPQVSLRTLRWRYMETICEPTIGVQRRSSSNVHNLRLPGIMGQFLVTSSKETTTSRREGTVRSPASRIVASISSLSNRSSSRGPQIAKAPPTLLHALIGRHFAPLRGSYTARVVTRMPTARSTGCMLRGGSIQAAKSTIRASSAHSTRRTVCRQHLHLSVRLH